MSPQPRLRWPLPTALGLSLAAIWHRLLDLRYGSAMFIFHRLYLKTIFPFFCILMISTIERNYRKALMRSLGFLNLIFCPVLLFLRWHDLLWLPFLNLPLPRTIASKIHKLASKTFLNLHFFSGQSTPRLLKTRLASPPSHQNESL